MKDISYLYNLLNDSKVSLFGFKYSDYIIKNEILSKINYIDITDYIHTNLSIKSILRDHKLDYILSGSDIYPISKFILLRSNDIYITEETDKNTVFNKRRILDNILENICSEIRKTDYNLIIMSSIYISFNGFDDNVNFSGGRKQLYISDSVFSLYDNKISIRKNRFGDNGSISLDGLNNYEYERI